MISPDYWFLMGVVVGSIITNIAILVGRSMQ